MKTVLLSGATRGLGLAIARRLTAEGYRVVGFGRTETDGLTDLVRDASPGEAHFVRFDLDDIDGIPQLVHDVTGRFGPLYGLVNNAAVGGEGLLATMHATDIDRVLRVNLTATIHLTKYACRSMLARRSGRIVNVTSIVARTGFSGLSVYAATKAGLEGFTRSLSRELGRVGVTVNCVAPGFMATDMTKGLEGENLDRVTRRSPLGLANVGDAAGAVAFFLGDDAARTTGTVITVDGGGSA